MKNAKTRAQRRRVAMLRKVLLTLTLVMVVAMVTVGGTIAWLADKTESIVNTFTVGDINIELNETTKDEEENYVFHIVPGVDIAKDPTVTVLADSEKCYLFVKVTEDNWPAFVDEDGSRKVDYQIAAGWNELESEDGVYWQIVESSESAQPFTVLADNKVTVSENLTKMDAEQIVAPTLTFQAFAVQHAEIADAEAAWDQAQNAANYPTNP